MVEINLLPWREYQAQYEKRRLQIMLILSAILALTMNVVGHIYFVNAEEKLTQQVNHLSSRWQETQAVQHQTINAVAADQKILHAIVSTQNFFTAFSGVNNIICFSDVTRKKSITIFTGYANSVVDLTFYLQHWPAGKLFSEVKINHFTTTAGNLQFRFTAVADHQEAE